MQTNNTIDARTEIINAGMSVTHDVHLLDGDFFLG